MFMCNLLGVSLLVAIALFHILGTEPEKNAQIITFNDKKQDWLSSLSNVKKKHDYR